MSDKTGKRQFTRLRTAMDKRHAHWLEWAEPGIDSALREEIADGASPEEVEQFISDSSGENAWFTRRVIGAARHISKTLGERG